MTSPGIFLTQLNLISALHWGVLGLCSYGQAPGYMKGAYPAYIWKEQHLFIHMPASTCKLPLQSYFCLLAQICQLQRGILVS